MSIPLKSLNYVSYAVSSVSMDSDFELPEVESEEEGDSDLYPLDGRYVNESDRQR